ncbi:hotdog fold thioesterase [Streptomyces sp. NBC_01351]|uniref:PaaI family thioesterase n=1 Tax=Streptomyces sp. NBC_01351 TaxID=2903833 RepID=UPI002E2F49E6|nr:hotdog fold domain-containing protein [Streptomyces sp. NBC_01351]
MSTFETITVPEHLHGYPGVAYGGYVAGLLAARATADTVRVDFRRPVPTETPVRLAGTPGGGCEATDGELLLAVATPAAFEGTDSPEAPSWEQAVAAAEAYRAAPPAGQVDCFGCGLDRTPATGLRLHCGVVPGGGMVATAWTPGRELGGADGILPAELVWGALDCPGNAAGRLLDGRPAGAVTAALTARLLRPVPVGEGLVSYAWLLSGSGRKYTVGTALTTAEGELCAVGEALWVQPRA